MSRIRNMNRRLMALIAIVAIAATGLSSMAALTANLTVTSTFGAANAQLSGAANGGTATPATVTLFDNQIISSGTANDVYKLLTISNTGNVALSVVQPAVSATSVATGTLLTNLKVQSWRVKSDYVGVPTCSAAKVIDTTMWGQIQGTWVAPGTFKIVNDPIPLAPAAVTYYCVGAHSDVDSTGGFTLTSVITGS